VESRSSSGAHRRQLKSRVPGVWRVDELKVAENIRQGGVYCVCIKYYKRVRLR
jgi:hypothetical protein